MQGNGESKELPTIKVLFDAELQAIGLHFENSQFKTWDFVIAILDMAKQHAEANKRMAQVNAMKQVQQEIIHDQAIKRQLKLG